MKPDDTNRKFGPAGIAWRVGAAAGLVSLCVFSTVRGASGAFDAVSLPVANLTGQNGIVSGTARMMGNHFLLYNGTRLESMAQSMEVNFERGGSMVMCPRSQLQILTSSQSAGMMLAFQSGGAQQPFPLRMGDEVITPDWRVELTSEARKGDMGIVQVVTNRHGDLCMQGNSQSGAYFKVSQLIGDDSFRVAGGRSERFADGKMETSSDGCGCNAEFVAKADTNGASASSAADGTLAPILTEVTSEKPVVTATAAPVVSAAPQATDSRPVVAAPAKAKRKHPEDLSGYVGAFVHKLFGR
ncbi:MAG TPA: hypothetical protein VGG15_01120 [Terriglobales bacterium]|jgi:hypothetical protein